MKNPVSPLIVFLLLIAISCNYENKTATIKEETSVVVRVTTLESKSERGVKSFYGTLNFRKSTDIMAELSGRVEELHAFPGQKLRKGEVIAIYPPTNHQLQIDQALIATEGLKTDLKRQSELLEIGAVPKVSVDELRTQFEIQQKMLEQLQAVGVIRAPFDGVVTQVHTHRGQEVHPGHPLLSLAATSDLQVEFFVPPREIHTIEVGASAYSMHNNKKFEGRVAQKSIEIDPQHKAFRVIAIFENDEVGFVGNTVGIHVQTASSSSGLWIPSGALRKQADGHSVFVARNGKAIQRSISIGERDEAKVQVVSGLIEGDQLIISGMEKLEKNTPIKIVE